MLPAAPLPQAFLQLGGHAWGNKLQASPPRHSVLQDVSVYTIRWLSADYFLHTHKTAEHHGNPDCFWNSNNKRRTEMQLNYSSGHLLYRDSSLCKDLLQKFGRIILFSTPPHELRASATASGELLRICPSTITLARVVENRLVFNLQSCVNSYTLDIQLLFSSADQTRRLVRHQM